MQPAVVAADGALVIDLHQCPAELGHLGLDGPGVVKQVAHAEERAVLHDPNDGGDVVRAGAGGEQALERGADAGARCLRRLAGQVAPRVDPGRVTVGHDVLPRLPEEEVARDLRDVLLDLRARPRRGIGGTQAGEQLRQVGHALLLGHAPSTLRVNRSVIMRSNQASSRARNSRFGATSR